jgi:hypothetical protein
MRQRIRDELCKLDREYSPVTMKSIYPDHFQRTHRLPSFVDPEKVANFDPSKKIELEDIQIEYDEDGNIILTDEEQITRTVVNPDLRDLDERIEQVELDLRALIHSVIDENPIKIPSHILRNVDSRIDRAIRKNPILDSNYLATSKGKLEYCDLRELQDIIVSKDLWFEFNSTFRSKENLNIKFDQLSELRNCIRHSRTMDEIVLKEGEASILWFEKILHK